MKRLLPALLLLAALSPMPGIASQGGNRAAAQSGSYLDRLPPGTRFSPGMVIVKFKSAFRGALQKSSVNLPQLSAAFLKYGVMRTTQMYPNAVRSFAANGSEIDIARMYRIEFAGTADPLAVAKEFAQMPEVEYADPEIIHTLAMVPNDPMYTQQYHLQRIAAPQAWDITTGDPNVVIAIVDTGVDWQHPDLKANIWVNPGEDINHDGKFTAADLNGVDDDGNGYIDDVIGIDFVGSSADKGPNYYDNDPTPTARGNPHGTHVAGIAAAVGNNGVGGTGVAFTCKFMPVKCTSDMGENGISRGYDGIVYAADMGAKIINCSWGGGGYTKSEEERIQYAISKGALVVAAAGNDGTEEDFSSPAAYKGVLSVANTNANDVKDPSSTYGSWIDIAAPGTNILSTVPSGGYTYMTGTSMASPCAAGVAALVKSHFPSYTPQQVAEQVRITSDNIDAKNPLYVHRIGFGRVNPYRALTLSSPSVRMTSFAFSDTVLGNGNGIIDPGETLQVTLSWKNYLAPTTNAQVTLTSLSPYATVIKGTTALGQLGTMQTATNAADPYVIAIKPTIPVNYRLAFTVTITDGNYQDWDGFFIYARPTYREHDRNDILVTIANDGHIGFDDFTGLKGKGFIYQNNGYNVLFEGAMMIGGKINNVVHLVDQARNESGGIQNTDFVSDQSVDIITPGKVADQEGFTSWTDDGAAPADQLGLRVRSHSYEFLTPQERNMVILRYMIVNTSANTITELHAGLFFDWDISTSAYADQAGYDTTTQTGYAWDISQINEVPTHVGVTVLTRDKPVSYMAIANPDKSAPPNFGIHDGFTKDEKWLSLSNGIYKADTYVTDISMVSGSGPYTLAPGDSCEVAFALLAGNTTQEVLDASKHAQDLWVQITKVPSSVERPDPAGFTLAQNYPNPFGAAAGGADARTSLRFTLPQRAPVRIEVADMLGRVVALLADGTRDAGTYTVAFDGSRLPAGVYIARLTSGNAVLLRKMVLMQ